MTTSRVPDPPPEAEFHQEKSLDRRRGFTFPTNFAVVNPAYVDQLSSAQLREIVSDLARGAVVWFPSDCSYALGVDPRSNEGVLALDVLLDHRGRPIPVTVENDVLASKLIRFSSAVIKLSQLWPAGIGLHTKPVSRFARRLGSRLHAPEGVVVRVSQSVIERQISGTAQLPITSAAMRDEHGQLVADVFDALERAVQLHEERTPHTKTFFIRDVRHRKARLAQHSTMLSVEAKGDKVVVLRRGDRDVDDLQRAVQSPAGVNWSDAT
jgi:tRNA A37 threonylcarbamoyladenosine synthetase subunit TsaC/SUA5/YrdC